MVLTLSLGMKSKNMTIQMKATEQYFPVVLFIMLYKVVLTFVSVDEILKCYHSNESYYTEHLFFNFPVVLFILLYKVVLTFVSVDEILLETHQAEQLKSTTFPCYVLLFPSVFFPNRNLRQKLENAQFGSAHIRKYSL